MGSKETTALDRNGLRHTEHPPSVEGRQLKPTTRKTHGPPHGSGRRQSKTPASRSRRDGRDSQYTELDDDNNDGNGNSGKKNDDEHNKGIEETNDQIDSDDVEITEDIRDDGGVESESESFVETYHDYRSYIRKATRREAEEEFLRNKRELIGLPKEHTQNQKQQKSQRFCPWALRQIKRRIKVLQEEEVARGEDSGSDGLSESDENKM